MLMLSLVATALAVPQGPAVDVDYDCVEVTDLEDAGRLYYPYDCDTDEPIAELPLVLFVHGAGISHLAYGSLAEHLAGNGYVTLIPDVSGLDAFGTVAERAQAALDALDALDDDWADAGDLNGELIAAGHSRGGEAAILVAKNAPAAWDVVSVVSLNPTDKVGLQVYGYVADNYLMITSLGDDDVRGRRVEIGDFCGVFCTAPALAMQTGFGIWDRSGVWSPLAPVDAVTRANVTLGTYPHSLQGTSQARAYMVLWLDWHVGGVDQTDVFYGGADLLDVDTSFVQLQYKAPGALVVEDFDTAPTTKTTYGTSGLTSHRGNAWQEQGTGDDYVFTSPHDTGVLALTWAPPALVRSRNLAFSLGGEDVSSYDSLSFRVGQVYGSDYVGTDDLELQVRLTDSAGVAATVDLTDYVAISPPPTHICASASLSGAPAGNYSKSPMQTVRIALSDFAGVDLTDLSSLQLIPTSTEGEIHLDDVQFTP